MNTRRSVVVTGVSSGIGLAIAEVLTARDIRVFGSVRNSHDAQRTLEHFDGKVFPLVFDITDTAAVCCEVRAVLGKESLAGLVNNAGIGTVASLLHVPISELRQQIEVNGTGCFR